MAPEDMYIPAVVGQVCQDLSREAANVMYVTFNKNACRHELAQSPQDHPVKLLIEGASFAAHVLYYNSCAFKLDKKCNESARCKYELNEAGCAFQRADKRY